MSEKLPTFEQREISEQEVLEALKTHGLGDKEARALHRRWIHQEWKKLPKDPIEMVKFNQRRGRLYRAAGYPDEAFGMLWDAREQLLQEPREDGRSALFQEIVAELRELEEEKK